MKRILIAPVAAALLSTTAFAYESMAEQKRQSTFGTKNSKNKEGFSLTSDIYFEEHATDYYRQTKYALADGIYSHYPNDGRLELYLEGKAGMQSESYRYESGFAMTTTDSELAVYVAAEVGAKYHLLDNVAVGAEVTMLENVSDEQRGQNVEMTLQYTF